MEEQGKPISIWHDIPLYRDDGLLNMIVEIPKESSAKMEAATVRLHQSLDGFVSLLSLPLPLPEAGLYSYSPPPEDRSRIGSQVVWILRIRSLTAASNRQKPFGFSGYVPSVTWKRNLFISSLTQNNRHKLDRFAGRSDNSNQAGHKERKA